jgi:hypothetical protein
LSSCLHCLTTCATVLEIPRPPTPPEHLASRAAFKQLLLTLPLPNAPTHAHISIPTAIGKVNAYHDVTTQPLGCWLTTKVNPDGNRIRLNVTDGGKKTMIYMSHLAIIASGRKLEQYRVVKHGQWQVSHLCHNPLCFNPEHLVVESEGQNQVRRELTLITRTQH